MPPLDPVVFSDVRGMNSADPPTRLPDDMATDVYNVLLEPQSLGRRRPSAETLSLTSGPSSPVYQLARHQPGTIKTGSGGAELWAFSGTSGMHRRANGTWSSVTGADTPALLPSNLVHPNAATFNGKFFLAYSSTVNRLHVWDGTSVRRVGIEASSAPTVADTGSGSYTATIRYYKVQFKIKSGSDVIATSELSSAQSFTPSGSGTAARVTKPTTPDSATHWVVFASSDNVTFYNLSGDTAVGTTTYDDSAAVSTYSAGTVAPTAGLWVPPPAAKYLLATDNRLFMAGCWAGSASSTQTSTRNSRVWFTAVLGARDNTGEDEAITQTTTLKHWVDCGENDGDTITGLAGPLDGAVYVFKDRSIWRLSPTGLVDAPYRADRVSHAVGAPWQGGIAMGEDGAGKPAIYFMSASGPKRIVVGYGIEDIGADVRSYTSATYSSVDDTPVVVWDPSRRIAWWITYASFAASTGQQPAYAFQPQFEQRTAGGVRGGWTRHAIAIVGDNITCAVGYENASGVIVPYVGGYSDFANAGKIVTLDGSSYRDVSATSLAPTVTSRIYQPGGLLRRVGFGHAVLEWDYPGAATAPGVSIASAIGGPLAIAGTVSDTATSSTYTTAVVQEKLESIQLSDVFGFQITVSWDASVDGTERPRIHSVTVPVSLQEGA